MNTMKRSISIAAAVVAASLALTGIAPAANAADSQSGSSYVVSTRSFPKVNVAKANFFAEATSTEVDKDSNWGGLGSMDVPQTKSTAEKEAEARAQTEKEAAEQRAQQEAAAQAAREQAAAASRDQARESLTEANANATQQEAAPAAQAAAAPSVLTSKNGAAIASYAQKFIGAPYVSGGTTPSGWDCSGFVMYVFSQFGINLPRTSGAQAGVGTAVPSLAEAQPGDIIANANHAAIYIGNGMIVNALNPAQGTQVTNLSAFGGAAYSIRRVL